MNIPKGYKLVPVELLERSVQAIVNTSQMHPTLGDLREFIANAPAYSQPIYDEAKELESCRSSWEKTGVGVVFADYWQGWLACAQSRAKAGEDE
ncbi:hypothetical protein [Pseudomonas sp. VB3]|uniref:hypothetical protein n=1 Tax=Pseudomonas sp. VB3 TaxID=2994641 RepID=UPI0022EC4570|nr:hypothetical protein [Pseudomonas sp. VB3]